MSVQGRRPKLIATDLDGTIVADYGFISERTISAFSNAHKMGIEIFFVTGRPPRWMAEIKEAFGFGNAICANGAMLFDLHVRQQFVEHHRDFFPIPGCLGLGDSGAVARSSSSTNSAA